MPPLGARPTATKEVTVDTEESSAPRARPSTENHDETVETHYACLERPCACIDGWVYLGIEEDGVERVEAVRCRRCAGGRESSNR